jgi:two-component sensor histidine kinase
MLDGKIVGAAIGGYALVDFSQVSEVQRIARDAGIAFERLWEIVRKQPPVPQSRLIVHGELLQVLGDALLRENCRARQYLQAAERQALLANELNHRVKNTLVTIQSFATQTLRSASDFAEARATLDARIIALSKAHDVLTHEHWDSADLHEVVTKAMAAYSPNGLQADLQPSGPEIRLRPQASLALSMALHELATNAAKYGALSNETGRVEISWTIRNDPQEFELRWEEKGGPRMIPRRRRGFGSRLIEQGLAQGLGGEVNLEFGKEGVVCTIRAPLDEIRGGTRDTKILITKLAKARSNLAGRAKATRRACGTVVPCDFHNGSGEGSMKASVPKAASPHRRTAIRNIERRLVTQHPRRRILSLAAGAAALPAISRIAGRKDLIRRGRCALSWAIRLAAELTSTRA